MIDSPDVLKSTVDRVREARSLGVDVDVNFHRRFHISRPYSKKKASCSSKASPKLLVSEDSR